MKICRSILPLLLSTVFLITCTEEDVISPRPECLLTHYGQNIYINELVDYSFVLEYDQQGRVVRRNRYGDFSNYEILLYYDSVAYEGDRVVGIYRKDYKDRDLRAWKFDYADRFETVRHYGKSNDELVYSAYDLVWRDSEGRITKTEHTFPADHRKTRYRFFERYEYNYDQDNLVSRDLYSYTINLGDTTNIIEQQEFWLEYAEAKNPFRGLPFIDLRTVAYSNFQASQFYQERNIIKPYPKTNTNGWKQTYRVNDRGYPNVYLYDCE